MADVLVVGAGISGLTLAYKLEQLGLSVTVVDSAPRVGGVIRSQTVANCQIETGPNTLQLSPEISELIKELGLENKLVEASPVAKKRYLGVKPTLNPICLVPAPGSFLEFLKSPLLSVAGKIRLLTEIFKSKTPEEDQSVYKFFRRRFGVEVAENIVSAVLNGIYAPDIRQLSTRSTLPKIWQAEQISGSVIRGLLKQKAKRGPICSFEGGLAKLTNQLARNISDIRLGVKVESINLSESFVEAKFSTAESLKAKKIVFTCSNIAAANLLAPIDQKISQLIADIPHSPVGILNLKVEKSAVGHPLDGFGFLMPPNLNSSILGCIFSSSIFPSRCSNKHALLTVFSGGMHSPELANVENEDIKARVIKEIKNLLTINGVVEVLSANHWSAAIANYPLGHYKTVSAISEFEKRIPQIKLLATWLDGVSLPDRVRLAVEESQQIAEEISSVQTQLKKEANG